MKMYKCNFVNKLLGFSLKLRNRTAAFVIMILTALTYTYCFIIGYTQLKQVTFSSYYTSGAIMVNSSKPLPVIYVVTPTYKRPTQAPDLTRVAQTLMLVKQIHWIVIEDATEKSDFVTGLLKRTELSVTHLNISSDRLNQTKVVTFFSFCIAVSWSFGIWLNGQSYGHILFVYRLLVVLFLAS